MVLPGSLTDWRITVIHIELRFLVVLKYNIVAIEREIMLASCRLHALMGLTFSEIAGESKV